MNHEHPHLIGPDGFFRPQTARGGRLPGREPPDPGAAYAGDLREAHARELAPVPLGPAATELVAEIERYLAFFAAVRNGRGIAATDPEETV